MTQKQMDAIKATLPRFNEPWTDEQKRLDSELWCREMINSCLVYHGERFGRNAFFGERTGYSNPHSYAHQYIKELGAERVNEIFEEQLADFRNAVVFHCVFTDDEGLTYNSIKWADEQ